MTMWVLQSRRHMLAEGAADKTYGADLARLPSAAGIGQAYLLASRLRKEVRQNFTHAFSSLAARAVVMSAILTAGRGLNIQTLPELIYPSKETKVGAAFARVLETIGTGRTLKPLLSNPEWPVLRKHGERALATVLRKMTRVRFDEFPIVNVLVTGHFPTLPLMFLAAVGGEGTVIGKQILKTPLLETAGYTAEFDGDKFVRLQFDD